MVEYQENPTRTTKKRCGLKQTQVEIFIQQVTVVLLSFLLEHSTATACLIIRFPVQAPSISLIFYRIRLQETA
ncbi:conserved hypothetical protein [Ricinus communis]|uniref:Uncharacterized protein n=1 Tax=Ricinus communis TaxID=3988 RepID=B9RND3_RICCO|nr:conserved hypothetical protein [Ricinus communis]